MDNREAIPGFIDEKKEFTQLQAVLTKSLESYFVNNHNKLSLDSFMDLVAVLKASPERLASTLMAAMNDSLQAFDGNALAEKVRIEQFVREHQKLGGKSLNSSREYIKSTRKSLDELGDITAGVPSEVQRWQEKFVATVEILVNAIDKECQSNIHYNPVYDKKKPGEFYGFSANFDPISSVIKKVLTMQNMTDPPPEGMHPKVNELFENLKSFAEDPAHEHSFPKRMPPFPRPGQF